MKKIYTFLFAYCLLPTAYCFSQGTWTQKANFGGGVRDGAVGFSIGSKGYIGLGGDVNGVKNDFWEWDQTTNVWTQKANFVGTARAAAVGFSIGTKGYIGTGYDGITSGGFINDFWEYDPTVNTWTQKANFPGTAREGATGFSIGNKGYIGTGYDSTNVFNNDFWEWDQVSNTWNQKANFPSTGRYGAVSFSIGNKGYIGTGWYNYSTVYNDFWEWDQATNVWTQKANLGGSARRLSVGFSIGIKGYIGTGDDGNNPNYIYYQDFWEWDQSSNTWTQKINLPDTVRRSAIGFSIGNYGYIGTGGISDAGFLNSYWEYCDTCSGTEVSEINLENLISVYPNPTQGKFNVQMSGFENVKINSIKIYSAEGECIHQQISTSSNLQIDLSSAPSGVYFVQLKTNKGVINKKIIKE